LRQADWAAREEVQPAGRLGPRQGGFLDRSGV